MLVLSRRIGEEIVIGGNIHVMVVAIKGNQVRVGVTAPASVPVIRRELLEGTCEAITPRTGKGTKGQGRRPPVGG